MSKELNKENERKIIGGKEKAIGDLYDVKCMECGRVIGGEPIKPAMFSWSIPQSLPMEWCPYCNKMVEVDYVELESPRFDL